MKILKRKKKTRSRTAKVSSVDSRNAGSRVGKEKAKSRGEGRGRHRKGREKQDSAPRGPVRWGIAKEGLGLVRAKQKKL